MSESKNRSKPGRASPSRGRQRKANPAPEQHPESWSLVVLQIRNAAKKHPESH
jgi:hypothetical protein